VTGKAAHPDQLEVAADLALVDAELLGDLADRRVRMRQQPGHQRQQPGQVFGRAAHALPPFTMGCRSC